MSRTLKMVLFAAIPKARERITTTRNAGFFIRLRVVKRISAPRVSKKGKVRMFDGTSSASGPIGGGHDLKPTPERQPGKPLPYAPSTVVDVFKVK
jgi:hypothetical protein